MQDRLYNGALLNLVNFPFIGLSTKCYFVGGA